MIGLAPSAAAAAVLGEQTVIRSDTLAKLTWSLRHGELPDWAATVGPSTLLVIDEAGMADTLTLDTVVQFAITLRREQHDPGVRLGHAVVARHPRQDRHKPWLGAIPGRSSQLITDLADQVRETAQAAAPAWTAERRYVPPADLVADVEVWRAAMQVQPIDLRPTGPEQPSLLARTWQRRPEQQIATNNIAQDQQWTDLLAERIPNLINDSFLPSLTERLENLDRAGIDAAALVLSAAAKGPLPDDHPAAAVWWRILDELHTRLPDRPNHQPPPEVPPPSATRLRQQRYRAPQTPRPTIGPSR